MSAAAADQVAAPPAASDSAAVDNTAAPRSAPLHRLASAWSLWYMPEMRAAAPGTAPAVNMNELLRKADTFHTVEEFWSIYNALPSADKLNMGELLMFFRDPTQPMWEDPSLANGEMLSLWTDSVDGADNFISRFLMAALGETLTVGQFRGKRNVIAGVRYSARRNAKGRSFKIDVWSTDASIHVDVEAAIKALAESSGIRNIAIFSQDFVKKKG